VALLHTARPTSRCPLHARSRPAIQKIQSGAVPQQRVSPQSPLEQPPCPNSLLDDVLCSCSDAPKPRASSTYCGSGRSTLPAALPAGPRATIVTILLTTQRLERFSRISVLPHPSRASVLRRPCAASARPCFTAARAIFPTRYSISNGPAAASCMARLLRKRLV